MNFRVGQKVVCVDARKNGNWNIDWLSEGAVYTIAKFLHNPRNGPLFPNNKDQRAVELAELPAKPGGFFIQRFRPLIERKTDISIFTAMLTPKQRERVTD